MSGFDIARARADTRACEDIVHFNNAGAALMPAPVADCLHEYLHLEERLGGYETADHQAGQLDNFYQACARLLNCSSGEIAFVENATRAWDMAFYAFRFEAGDRILTTIEEYGSNVIAYLQQAKRYGVEVLFVPNDDSGQLDLGAMQNLIDERVKLISITHIPTGGGVVNPAAAVGQIARAANIPYLLDSCQGIGQLAIDVDAIGCDIACGTGRKYLRGPRGTGLLYVRESMIEQLEPPFLDLHAATLLSADRYRIRGDAGRFENWEQFYAGKAALGKAIDYAMSFGLDAIQTRIYALADLLRTGLGGIDGVEVTDTGIEQCGIVTFMTAQMRPAEIESALKQRRINVSISEASGNLVAYRQRNIPGVVRASLHYYNNESEIDYFIESLKSILAS